MCGRGLWIPGDKQLLALLWELGTELIFSGRAAEELLKLSHVSSPQEPHFKEVEYDIAYLCKPSVWEVVRSGSL